MNRRGFLGLMAAAPIAAPALTVGNVQFAQGGFQIAQRGVGPALWGHGPYGLFIEDGKLAACHIKIDSTEITKALDERIALLKRDDTDSMPLTDGAGI